MKNITALVFLVIINFAFFNINPLFSQEAGTTLYTFSAGTPVEKKRYKFSVSPQVGIVYGQAFEYVYPVQGETKAELLSELKWDMKPVFYAGLQLDFEPVDIMRFGFFSSLSFKAGLPKDSGVIEDRDWMFHDNSDLTRFSSHTNKTNSYFDMDAAIGVLLPIRSIIYIKPFISGSWMRFSFTGRDGYGIYNDLNPKEQNFSWGKVITYQQDWLLLAAGFSVATKVFYPFAIDLSFQISPFTYCAATDNHFLRDTIFRDFTGWGLFLEPSIKIFFVVKPVEFSLGLSYRHIGKTKGKSYFNNSMGFELDDHKAGAGLSIFDSLFLVKIRLF